MHVALRLCLAAFPALMVGFHVGMVTAASPSVAPAAAGNVRVSVEHFAFSPPEITLPAGASVTWAVRIDPEQHTITPAVAGAFVGSRPLFAGDDYTVRFGTPGRFRYTCSFHPFMTGTVVVTKASGSAAPASATSTSVATPTAEAPSTASVASNPGATASGASTVASASLAGDRSPVSNSGQTTDGQPAGPALAVAAAFALSAVVGIFWLARRRSRERRERHPDDRRTGG